MGLYASRWPETTILDNKDGKFVPPPPHPPPSQIKDGKMARFGFYSASSLSWWGGGGGGFAGPFYSVQDCSSYWIQLSKPAERP